MERLEFLFFRFVKYGPLVIWIPAFPEAGAGHLTSESAMVR